MNPGPYEIPTDVQEGLLEMSHMLVDRANQPRAPIDANQKIAMLAIAEKLELLGSFNFSSGNQMGLMKPDFTFGYVRMGCEIFLNDRLGTPPPVFQQARRVRDWLDKIGHKYPRRHR